MRDQEQRRRIRLENKFISQNVFAGAEEVLTYLTVIKLNQSLISSKISPNAPTHHDEVKRHRLCISVLPKGMQVAGIPGQMDYAPKLHLLKIKGPKKYHLKGTWPLKSILKIDGLDSASEDKKFSLSCSGGKRGKKNQIFFFEAVNDHAHDSRNWFFWMMIQISGVFLQIVPLTSNLDVMALEENGRNRLSILGPSKSENKNSSSITEEICEAEETLIAAIEKNLLLKNKRRPSIYEELGEKFEIPPMTPEEARDIEWFLSDTGLGIEKIHELKGVLLSKLESLDSQNTIALFSSQLAQNPIAKGLSNLKQDVLDVREWMHQRDKEMKRMRMGIEQIESRNQKLDLLERNNQKLVQTLENLFKAISIDQESMLVLQNPDFRSPKGLKAAVTASQLLLHHLDSNSTIFADLNDMLCVKEKRVMLEALGTNFCNIAFEFLESLFTSFSKELSETASLDTRSFSTAVSFQSHEETHSLLQRYLSLCLQLQRMAEVRFESFRNHYTSNFRICYEKQIKSYFNGLKKVILKDKIDRKMVSMPTFELSPRLSNFKLSEKDLAQRRSSSFSPQWSTTSNKVLLDKILVHDAFALTLNSLARVIMEEWSFCYEMFAIHVDNAEDLKLSDKNGSSGFEDEVDLERREIENREVMKNRADINSMVEKLFKGVDAELLDLVDLASSIDQFSTIRMIIQTKKTHDKFAGQCDYLSGLLIGIQDKLHSNFKNYINEQAQWIESLSSTAKKLQVGIPIQKFPTFVLQVERVIEESSSGVSSRGLKKVSEASDSERESSELGNSSNSLIVRDPIIEKSYHRLISSIFKWIEGIASQDPKYQSVVLTTNFFQFWSTFSSLEVDFPGMQDHIQHAYSYYMDHQERYIKWHIEYEMPDVIQFWDLLDNQLAAVSSSADIPFTPCLSRQDLRLLCSRRLDLKPLTSSISNLYSRVTKHFKLSRDLASRIWLSTRDHFQARYQRFEQLVTDCYRNETVSVSSSDVAALFSSQFPDDHPHPSTD